MTYLYLNSIQEFVEKHRPDITKFMGDNTKLPPTFLGSVAARLVEITVLQNPLFVMLHRQGISMNGILDLVAVGVLLGIYAERQGWTMDIRDLDLSAFED